MEPIIIIIIVLSVILFSVSISVGIYFATKKKDEPTPAPPAPPTPAPTAPPTPPPPPPIECPDTGFGVGKPGTIIDEPCNLGANYTGKIVTTCNATGSWIRDNRCVSSSTTCDLGFIKNAAGLCVPIFGQVMTSRTTAN